jgi:hypothetical protein
MSSFLPQLSQQSSSQLSEVAIKKKPSGKTKKGVTDKNKKKPSKKQNMGYQFDSQNISGINLQSSFASGYSSQYYQPYGQQPYYTD